MFTEIGNTIRITYPEQEIIDWCRDNLEMPNPDFAKKQRMGFWTGRTPVKLYFYELDGNTIIIPFGCLRDIKPLITDIKNVKQTFLPKEKVDFGGTVPLYEYQEKAVDEMFHNHYGILQSPAGSGKTQMGIALAVKHSVRTLWLTHTKDLLNQSKERAERYIDPDKLGTITEGKVHIGETMTFATIQTMYNVDLDKYKDTWDCIIVDECHRVSGTPTTVTRFYHVLNSLRARHKYGLSATVHRADGLIKATYALLGKVVYTVPDEAVEDFTMDAVVKPVNTYMGYSDEYLNYDGTINYPVLITYLCKSENRNGQIIEYLWENRKHYNLVLSERVSHLNTLIDRLPTAIKDSAVVISGTTKKDVREKAIQDMRDGKKHFLFATYALCKEGLDIPRLDRLYMTTPQKDYAVIVQSVGRVRRTFPDKETPYVYDFVDAGIKYLWKSYKKRCTHYRKCGCEVDD